MMDFHSNFSDDSAQNSATIFDNINKFSWWMDDNNLFLKDGIIYDTTYG